MTRYRLLRDKNMIVGYEELKDDVVIETISLEAVVTRLNALATANAVLSATLDAERAYSAALRFRVDKTDLFTLLDLDSMQGAFNVVENEGTLDAASQQASDNYDAMRDRVEQLRAYKKAQQ